MITKLAETLYNEEVAAIAQIGNSDESNIASGHARTIETAMTYLQTLKKLVIEGTFTSREEEIVFFKKVKPLFNAQMLYHVMLEKVELEKPHRVEALLRNYYENRMAKVHTFFEANREIYSYYRTGASHLDELLFLREQASCPTWLIRPRVDFDERFCTAGDYAFAQIIAHDWLASYIDVQLNGAKVPDGGKDAASGMRWTGEQVNLVELIYGIYYTGQLNNGNAEVKDILALMERVFGVKIKAAYHVFGNIRRRKSISPTAFLDKMREAILKRVDDDLAYHPQRDKLRNRP